MTFYEAAGFDMQPYDAGFAFVQFADASVFDLDLKETTDPVSNGAGCFITTDDVEPWHARPSAAGLPVTAVADMPWGMRGFTLTDPTGNRLRIGRAI